MVSSAWQSKVGFFLAPYQNYPKINVDTNTIMDDIHLILTTIPTKNRHKTGLDLDTPSNIAHLMALQRKGYMLRACDLMAGTGSLTSWLEVQPNSFLLAVDANLHRVTNGQNLVPNATWICADVFSRKFIERYVVNERPYDFIVSNPLFSGAMATLNLASYMLAEAGIIVCILPTHYWTNKKHALFYERSNLQIIYEIKLGKVAYYNTSSKTRQFSDSIFVFRKTNEKQYISKWSYLVKPIPKWVIQTY